MIFERVQIGQVEINDLLFFGAGGVTGRRRSGVTSAPAGVLPLSTACFSETGLSFFVGSLRRPILDVHQAAVDRQRARREAEGENLIRQRKVVFDWIARGIVFILHVRLPSAVLPIDGTAPSVRQAGCRSAATESRPHAEVHRRSTAKRPACERQAARLETAAARQNF